MKRTRNKQMIIRMTDTEVSEFDKKMKEAKFKSRADFIMALVRDVKIIVPEGLKDIAVELKKEGNNFNQAVRLWNKTKTAEPPVMLKWTAQDLGKLYKRLSNVLEGMKNADLQSRRE